MAPTQIRAATVGEYRLVLGREPKGYIGAIFKGRDLVHRLSGDGLSPDALWMRLHDELAMLTPHYIGYAGAMKRFRSFFPDGMTSPAFAQWEGDYKRKAKAALDEGAPLVAARSTPGLGPVVARVFKSTNLLDPNFEAARMGQFLAGPDADAFIAAAAAFAEGEIAPALKTLAPLLAPAGLAKWTIVTYLPFLWRPDAHMFLKPEATTSFADRVGHEFAQAYASSLTPAVYASLLALTAETKVSIAALEPADNIDVQSFIWTVEKYQPGDGPKA